MQTITITYPTETLELLPVPRSRLRELRQNFVKLHSYWVESVFSLADVVLDDECWALMSAIAAALPHVKNPAITGFDLEVLQTDLAQLEALFFCEGKTVSVEEVHGYSVAAFNLKEFAGCQILNLHKFNPHRILEEAEALRIDRQAAQLQAAAEAVATEKPAMPAKPKA